MIGAVLHHHQNIVAVLEQPDIPDRISIDHDEIGEVAILHQLLLEESVNHILAALLRRPEAIESANLRFRQKRRVRNLWKRCKLATEKGRAVVSLRGPSLPELLRDFGVSYASDFCIRNADGIQDIRFDVNVFNFATRRRRPTFL